MVPCLASFLRNGASGASIAKENEVQISCSSSMSQGLAWIFMTPRLVEEIQKIFIRKRRIGVFIRASSPA
jgi:hypothetical protein